LARYKKGVQLLKPAQNNKYAAFARDISEACVLIARRDDSRPLPCRILFDATVDADTKATTRGSNTLALMGFGVSFHASLPQAARPLAVITQNYEPLATRVNFNVAVADAANDIVLKVVEQGSLSDSTCSDIATYLNTRLAALGEPKRVLV
jgi:hypothetical protein